MLENSNLKITYAYDLCCANIKSVLSTIVIQTITVLECVGIFTGSREDEKSTFLVFELLFSCREGIASIASKRTMSMHQFSLS